MSRPGGQNTLMRIHRLLRSMNVELVDDHLETVEEIAQIIVALNVEIRLSRYRLLSEELLRAVINKLKRHTKIQLALKISHEINVPKAILLTFANDVGEVALPILRCHIGLRDKDLVEIAFNHAEQHRIAIASRSHINEIVTQSLTCFGEYEVIKTVLCNSGARINEQAFIDICRVAKRRPDLHGRLVARPDLPIAIAFGMLEWVTKEHSESLYDMIENTPNALKKIIATEINENTLFGDIHKSACHRIENSTSPGGGWLAEDVMLIMAALPNRSLAMKIALASDYTGQTFRAMKAVILAGDTERFAKICKSANIPTKVFSVMVDCIFGSNIKESSRETQISIPSITTT